MNVKDQIRDIVPDGVLRGFSGNFTVIGDIAILSLAPEMTEYAPLIARAIISRRHNIRTVMNKTTRVCGCDRTAHLELITGTDTVTTHHEYGFAYRLDVQTVFYNPRLACERKRVTDQVQYGERVLVPFCGVGPFVIPAAARGADVIAVEQNPDACRWLAENLALNGVSDRVTTLHGDAFDTSLIPAYLYDRVIIPTPYGRDTIFDHCAPRVRRGGMIHFYTFKNREQVRDLAGTFECSGFEVMVVRKCGNVAPAVSRWVFDLRVTAASLHPVFSERKPSAPKIRTAGV
jgi:tRNA (guanine37-N1)-methyltransferase